MEGVRLRLDRAYIEALGVHQMEKKGTPQNEVEVMELQAELDSLYSEILPVAQMSAEQRYLDCAVRAIASQDKQGLEKSKTIIGYVCLTNVVYIEYYSKPSFRFQNPPPFSSNVPRSSSVRWRPTRATLQH